MIRRAHPQIVRGNRAQFCHEKMRRDLVAQLLHREYGLDSRDRAAQDIQSATRARSMGVKFMLKCGSRSYHGPGMPCCSVQLSAGWPVDRMQLLWSQLCSKKFRLPLVRVARLQAGA